MESPPNAPLETGVYYVLKVEGKAKIPDYIQVRDSAFTLIGYFRPGRGGEKPSEYKVLFGKIEILAKKIPFGVITKIEIER